METLCDLTAQSFNHLPALMDTNVGNQTSSSSSALVSISAGKWLKTRREWLTQMGMGLGGVALADLLNPSAVAAADRGSLGLPDRKSVV